MQYPSLVVRVDSKHHFVYTEDRIPPNYAMVTFRNNDKPTGLVAIYELVKTDSNGAVLTNEVKDARDGVSASEAIAAHVRSCLLPRMGTVGDTFEVSFIGKAFNKAELKWQPGICQVRLSGRQDL
jgi:hypothetical protein